MEKTYQTLEFNTIRSTIAGYCVSSTARENILALVPIHDSNELKQQQLYQKEAMSAIFRFGRLPIGHFEDISKILQKANKDGTLFGEDFNQIVFQLQNVNEVQKYFVENELEEMTISLIAKEMEYVKNVHREIQRCIDASGQVADHASSELKRIRKSLLSMEANIRSKIMDMQKQYKDALSQETVASRNEHLVLPVKAANRNKVKGIVHALSASGQTMFIEPEEVVQMNNQLVHLQEEEKREVQRILFALSQLVKQHSLSLEENQKILFTIDEIFAKAMYGVKIDGVLATIDQESRTLALYHSRHPLIDPNDVVSNDIVIDQDKRMLLISGSNTGGKTVVLKTVGLLSVMALSGLAIPAREATIPLFDAIYVDLGDEQSIEQSLSTFSSHMKRLVTICKQVTSQSLVLLDEIGSGTDPQEGESIAEAILEYLHHKDALTIASTHYSGLKQFAKRESYILIGAVEFDQENMKPTYRLLMGNVGNSYAIEISSRLGLPEEIVMRAKQIKESHLSESDRLLEKLQDELTRVQKEKDDLASLTNEANHKLDKYNRLLASIEKQKEKALQDAKDKANTILEEAKKQVDEVVDTLKQQQVIKPHVAIEAKHMLDVLKHEQENKVIESANQHEFAIGDKVKVLAMNRLGDVIAISKKGITVDIGGIKLNAKPQELEFMSKKAKPKPVKTNLRSIKKTTSQGFEINVIGKRYEEAMALVDKFLDDALVHNYSMVRIVHGMGTGVLRNGVRKMLDKNKHVVSYRDGGPNEGGLGATLVYFE